MPLAGQYHVEYWLCAGWKTVIKCRWAYVCVYLGDNPIFCLRIAMKIVQTTTNTLEVISHKECRWQRAQIRLHHKFAHGLRKYSVWRHVNVAQTKTNDKSLSTPPIETEHIKRIIMSNVNGFSQRAFHRIAKYLFIIIQPQPNHISHTLCDCGEQWTQTCGTYESGICTANKYIYMQTSLECDGNLVTIKQFVALIIMIWCRHVYKFKLNFNTFYRIFRKLSVWRHDTNGI